MKATGKLSYCSSLNENRRQFSVREKREREKKNGVVYRGGKTKPHSCGDDLGAASTVLGIPGRDGGLRLATAYVP